MIAGSGCGLLDAPPPLPTPPPSDANLLANPGFEDGGQGWIAPQQAAWTPFTIVDGPAHGGGYAMRVQLPGDPSTPSHTAGGVQALDTHVFPEFLSGFYRVDSWRPNAALQYLQFVVRVAGGDMGVESPTYEVRFLVAGAERDTPTTRDAHLIFISRAAPVIGRWTYFSYPVRRAFELRFSRAPLVWDSIQVSLEVRYDGITADAAFEAADVYFDDLYVGYQFQNPNRPDDP